MEFQEEGEEVFCGDGVKAGWLISKVHLILVSGMH
jgi:hypothetical protein